MAGPQYSSDIFLAYSPTFKKQTAFGTPRPNADMIGILQAKEDIFFDQVVSRVDIKGCNGEFIRKRQLEQKYFHSKITINFTPTILAGFLAACLGSALAPVSGVHGLSLTSQSQLPLLTFIKGYRNDTVQPLRYSNCVVNSVEVTVDKGEPFTKAVIDMIVAAEDLVTFTAPACVDTDFVLNTDCSYSIGGNDYTSSTLDTFGITIDNKITIDRYSRALNSIYLNQILHGIREVSTKSSFIGSRGDTTTVSPYLYGANEDTQPVVAQFGTGSDKAVATMANTIFSLPDQREKYVSNAKFSAFDLNGACAQVSGVKPITVDATVAQTSQFLSIT